jgi:hypothetical protein
MAIRYAVATGNWSSIATWDGLVSVPGPGDDVYSNNKTVTIDTSPTVLSISNAAVASPVVAAGGSFVPTNGITLKATVSVAGGFANTGAISSSLASPSQATIESPLFKMASSTANYWAVSHSGTGILNIAGNVRNDLANNINGAVTCVINSGSGILNITGDIASASTGINYYGSGHAVVNTSTGTINISGSVAVLAGGLGGNAAICNLSTGTINLTANTITGHSFAIATTAACLNASTGTFNIIGNAFAGVGSPAILNNSTGSIFHSGQCVANNGVAAFVGSSMSASVTLTGPFITSSNGTNPVYSPRWFWLNSPAPTYYQIRTANLATIRPLYTADSVGGNPSVSNVRSGTIFGPSNELTGTVAVPPANSVLTGVPVDNTVGSGSIDPTQFWNYPISGITTSGSIGERLKTAATVNVMGQLISDSFSAR